MPNFENPQGQVSREDLREQIRREEEQKKLQQKLYETIGKIEARVEELSKKILPYCDPSSGMCFLTRGELQQFLEEQNKKIPQILDGAQDLTSFFQKVAKEEPGGRLYKILAERMPTAAKVNLVKFLCGDDEECRLALEKDPDIKIRDTGQRQSAFLGR